MLEHKNIEGVRKIQKNSKSTKSAKKKFKEFQFMLYFCYTNVSIWNKKRRMLEHPSGYSPFETEAILVFVLINNNRKQR